MKKLLVATALVAFVATPALAQQGPWGSWQRSTQINPSSQTYMYAPEQQGMFLNGAPSIAVVVDGMIIGQDPDPNVRLEMLRNSGLTSPSES